MSSKHLVIVGAGPRGLMVLERIIARLSHVRSSSTDKVSSPSIRIDVFDKIDVDAGQIYRSSQPDCLLMNTIANQITAFSGEGSFSNAMPGSGPSLAEWARHERKNFRSGYASRKLYGSYMSYVRQAVCRNAPSNVEIHHKLATVTSIVREDDEQKRFTVETNRKTYRHVSAVILATGHSISLKSTNVSDDTIYGNELVSSVDSIDPGEVIGVRGLGLSFYDLMSLVTENRGGEFRETSKDGHLEYIPSGKEPVIYAYSRSGVPFPSRGVNQKPPNFSYSPVLFREERVSQESRQPFGRNFSEIFQWLKAEVEFTYHYAYLRRQIGPSAASKFYEIAVSWNPYDSVPLTCYAQKFGSTSWEFDITRLSRPVGNRYFRSRTDYNDWVSDYLRQDIRNSVKGNVDSPIKAALDVLRDARSLIRKYVEHGRLNPTSYVLDFQTDYCPKANFLSAGPPVFRVKQVLALINAGVVVLTGPNTVSRVVNDRRILLSKQVDDVPIEVSKLFDAKVPEFSVESDGSELYAQLKGDGYIKSYCFGNAVDKVTTGGMDFDPVSMQVVDAGGKSVEGLYVVGIPTEGRRWFTTVGSTRPGQWSEFVTEPDTIAKDIVERYVNVA